MLKRLLNRAATRPPMITEAMQAQSAPRTPHDLAHENLTESINRLDRDISLRAQTIADLQAEIASMGRVRNAFILAQSSLEKADYATDAMATETPDQPGGHAGAAEFDAGALQPV